MSLWDSLRDKNTKKCAGFNVIVVGYRSKKARHVSEMNDTHILKLVH